MTMERSKGSKSGFGKPPKNSRYPPGKSGNPRGRPKGSKNRKPITTERFKSLFLDEVYRELTIGFGKDRKNPHDSGNH